MVAVVLLVPVLWLVDCTGPEETVQAEVLRTRLWRHKPQGASAHNHTAATLVIEGLTEATVQRADGLERGQRVAVRIRRGRITGWAYFAGLEEAGVAPFSEPGGAPEPLEELPEEPAAEVPEGQPPEGGLELEDPNG